ncbi:MAG: hypothetical protein WDO73_28905 [Ignavibacteriota bacterium]
MTSTPAMEATVRPQSLAPGWRVPLALYTLTGFGGLLAEQGFEKYLQLLVGATASASAVVLFTYFLGFALGGVAAAKLIRRGLVARPLLVYGMVELAVGLACVLFTYTVHPLMSWLAPLQNLVGAPVLKLQVRFVCGCILVLPTAALMGASFPLIAQVLENRLDTGVRREPGGRTGGFRSSALRHHASIGAAWRDVDLSGNRHCRVRPERYPSLLCRSGEYTLPKPRRRHFPGRFAFCWQHRSGRAQSSSRWK